MARKSIDEQIELSKKFGINLVRFLYCDLSGMVRGKATTLSGFKERVESGIGLVQGMIAMNCLDKMQSETGYGPIGEVRLIPDLDTFTPLPYASGSASMFCDMQSLDRTAWNLCPRSFLRRQLIEADEMGISIQAAFEPEFMLGVKSEQGEFIPIDRSVCFGTTGMNAGNRFIAKTIDYLQRQGIQVEQYYPELGHGQHELSIAHSAPLAACDRYLLLKETIRGVAREQEIEATFAAKPFENQPGNGCHLHLSLWDKFGERNLLWSENGLSSFGLSFVAGLINHLPSLVALTCPSYNSYRRLVPSSWSSAFRSWGYENREAAIRVPSVYWGHEMESTNIELKCVDNTINPYLALGAVIACGLDGIRRNLDAPPPVNVDPSTLSDNEQKELGISRLPTNLHNALVELETDLYLIRKLQEPLAHAYIAVKNSEVDSFKHDPDFEMEQHRLRY